MTDERPSAGSEGDISERLRKEAFEAVDWNGETMKQWDKIRALCAERDGSDLPRLMFESLIESLSELMIDGANEIDRLRQVMRAPAQPAPHNGAHEFAETMRAAPVDHLLQNAVFASGEIVQDHLPDCSAGNARQLPAYVSNAAREAARDALDDLETNTRVDSDAYTLAQHMMAFARALNEPQAVPVTNEAETLDAPGLGRKSNPFIVAPISRRHMKRVGETPWP